MLHNQYGPSETHVVSEFTLRAQVHTWPTLPPIGHALPHVRLWVQDELGQPLRPNQPGELYVGRGCLAWGDLHRESLTAERCYKTGR